ncbi:hypothetical protein [Shewanella sp. Isolate8]|uniref:hypothetical protein n=1 Tax=Shewanella sp. Isolate8 TaxID=2908529 RepID=UPI001EFED5A3|nr:hypothetical protein [Shewanella sp. Isolate8]MCG9745651.1 hypothetical protein [Shewanella sp. Isolate8]
MFEKKPIVKEIELSREYDFSYENFVLATQHEIYLLIEKSEGLIYGIKFKSRQVKYGGPNDEARGRHPLIKYGLGFYGFFEVENSPWIKEQIKLNKVHTRHSNSLFSGLTHYVACFQDVMLEVTSRNYEEFQITQEELNLVFQEQVSNLEA